MGQIKKIMSYLLLLGFAAAVLLPSVKVQAGSTSAPDFQMKGNTLVKYTGTASVVTVPTYVKKIGEEAFKGHDEIVRINLPAYMEEIGYDAFNGCTSLEKIMIPDTVTTIGAGAFSGCINLKSIYLGKKLSKIGTGIFTECTGLNVLNIHKDNNSFSYEKGVLYDKEKTIVYCMLPGYESGVYQMPLTVKEIKNYAFWGCPYLTKVELSGNVSDISDYAFANCWSLEKVLIPYSVYRIGIGAFSNCERLGETEIPASVEEIHASAFEECPSLIISAPVGSKGEAYAKTLPSVPEEEVPAAAPVEAKKQEMQTTNTPAKGNGSLLGQTRVVNGRAVVVIDGNQSKVMGGGTN